MAFTPWRTLASTSRLTSSSNSCLGVKCLPPHSTHNLPDAIVCIHVSFPRFPLNSAYVGSLNLAGCGLGRLQVQSAVVKHRKGFLGSEALAAVRVYVIVAPPRVRRYYRETAE